MKSVKKAKSIAIVDYGLGNLFSIKNACEFSGLAATITSSAYDLEKASAVILPGVGAFGEAMRHLKKLDLVIPLRDLAASGKPLVGICLGMQLLMSESREFGANKGLEIIQGEVLPFNEKLSLSDFKVPHIGWNCIYHENDDARSKWCNSLLCNVPENAMMYFVHSYYCEPYQPEVVLSKTRYGGITFCSSFSSGNVHAFQFHPERSGREGLLIYKALAQLLLNNHKEEVDV